MCASVPKRTGESEAHPEVEKLIRFAEKMASKYKLCDVLLRLVRKYKEVLLYLIFGGLTTVVNYLVLWLANDVCGITALDGLVANAIAWVAAVIFAFVTNKLLVFESKETDSATMTKETISFFLARLFSLGVESLVIYIGVTLLGFNLYLVKLFASVLVIILNYVFSKLFIFRKKPEDPKPSEGQHE